MYSRRTGTTVAVDLAACAAVHVAAGYLVHRLPDRFLDRDRWLFRERAVEGGGRLYVRGLRIRRWKKLLPEAGGVFPGGFDKAALRAVDDAYLRAYLVETRRAELGHWLAVLPAPLFFLWNPWYAGVVVQACVVVANGPCIASQRYNRVRLKRVLARRTAQRNTDER